MSPPPPLLLPLPRGNWTYDWARFPAAWFGTNWTGWETEEQMQKFGKYTLFMLGWQAMQGPSNYSHTLRAQFEQVQRVKERYPHMPCVLYVPSDGASPLFDAMLPLFEDFQRYKNFFYLNASGEPYKIRYKCAINTTHSGSSTGVKAKGCEVLDWNFYNTSARDYYLDVVLKRIAEMDSSNQVFDGIFFDAAMGFMRTASCPAAAANCRAGGYTQAETDAIGIEILRRTVTNLAKWGQGKVPIFNAHYADMSFNNDTIHSESAILDAITESGGAMMRYYDGDGPLSIALIDNALEERLRQIPTVFHVKGKKQKTIDAVAVFLLIRQKFSYFMESTGYYDRNFEWHAAYDLDYGLPLSAGPSREVNTATGTVEYSRTYTRCVVAISCNVSRCQEKGADLIHNCCSASIVNTSTGRIVV